MFNSRLFNYLKIPGLFAAFFLLSAVSAHAGGRILTSENVQTKTTQFFEVADNEGNKIPATKRERHYYIRFEKDDSFTFIIPEEHMGAKESAFYNEGQTMYWWQPDSDGPIVPLAISNRVLQCRAALIGAKKYFDGVAEENNIRQTWWESGPIRVLFGTPSASAGALASAGFWNHQISVKPDMVTSFSLSTVVIHEYFHMVYDAVWYDGSARTFWKKYTTNSKDPFSTYLIEMTAEWATDEPVKFTDAITGKQVNQDDNNNYLLERSQYGFFDRNEEPFFDRGEYVSNVLIKYLAEQMAGAWGADQSAADRIMKMIYATYAEGGVNKDTFFKNIAQAVMSHYWPGEWQEVWLNFYTAFCASNLVQKASANEKPEMPLGYHDDAFKNLQDMVWVKSGFIQDDVTKVPPRVYSEPARDDEERMERMETILGGDELIEPLAAKYHNLTFRSNRDEADPRPVFVYAKGTPESDVFLIRQRYSKDESSFHRKSAKFLWNDKFNFKDQHDSKEPKSLGIYPAMKQGQQIEELWVGLVNPSTSLRSRVISWSWLAAPRLVPHLYVAPEAVSKTVRIIGGTAYTNARPEGIRNGETFEAEIRSTGPLHRDGANLGDIAESDRSIKFEVLGPNNQPVSLEKQDGKEYKVRMSQGPVSGMMTYTYIISGKFAETNPVTGDCRFKIKLTSPLNLGEGDEQIDETYRFKLVATVPEITQFIVKQGGEIIYENGVSKKFPKADGGIYRFDLAVQFSIPMEVSTVNLTAGIKSPYNAYKIINSRMNASYQGLTGTVEIPQSDVPKSGAILKFAVSGESQKGGAIDGDLFQEGAQPDTSNFLLLGIEQFYDFEITTTADEFIRQGNYGVNVNIRPMTYKMRMMPDISEYDGSVNEYMHVITGRLEYFQKFLAQTDESIAKVDGESSKFGGNKKAQWESELREKEKRLQGMKKTLTMKNKFPNYPDFEKNMKEAIRVLENDIREQKRGGPGQAIKSKDEKMNREKERLQFLKTEFVPRYEAMVRMMSAYRKYLYKPDLGGAASGSFGGFLVQGRPVSGQYSENYGDYVGKIGSFEVKTAQAEFRGWNSGNVSSLAKDPFDQNTSPRVFIWEYDPEDFKKVRELAEIMKNPPPLLKEAIDAGPIQMRGGSQSEILMNTLAQQISAVFMSTDRDIHMLIEVLWRFYPSPQRPKTEDAFDADGKLKPEALVFPDTQNKILVRIESPDALPMNIPLEFEGYTFELTHRGNEEPMAWIPHEPGTEKETENGDGFKKEITRTKYVTGATTTGIPAVKELGYTTRSDISVKTNIKWGGVTPPPLFFDQSAWELELRNAVGYFSSSGSGRDAKVTMEGCFDKFDLYDPGNFGVEIYGACKSNPMEGALNGKIHYQSGSETFFYDMNWKTKFVLKKVEAEGGAKVAEAKPAPKPEAQPQPAAPESPKPEPAKPEKPKPPLPWGQGTNPDTGITTEVQGNEDGSRTVTKTGKDGKVISTERVPPPGERLPSGSSVDPFTGNKIEVQGNADGTRTVTRMDPSGKVLSQEILKP